MNEAVDFMKSYCDFSNPHWVYLLKGMARNKDNGGVDCKFMRRYVITKPEDLEDGYNEIMQVADTPDVYYRMYLSFNARDAFKTAFHFQRKLAEIGLGLAQGHEDALQMSKKISSLWKTELAQKHNRATKYFLLDIDDSDRAKADEILEYAENHGVQKVVFRPTVSGFHLIFHACDTRGLMEFCKDRSIEVQLNRDSELFIKRWKV